MKVVIVGSAHSVHIRKIADNLAERGHKVSVFSEESSLTESSPQIYSPEVKLFDKWPAGKIARKISFLIRLNLYLLRTNADIVWFVYASSYGRLTPKVFTFAKKVVSVWGSDILINSYKKAYIKKISSSLNKADLVFSTSEFLRAHTRRLTSAKIVLTPYGPNDSFFSEVRAIDDGCHQALQVAKSFEKVIICTKWLKSVYGIDILVEAIALHPSYFRDANIGVLICGEGQDSGFLKELVETENVGDIVRFVGFQTESQVISLLQNAHLAVFPSRSESFGVSLLECFAQKVPVICSSAGGFNELSHGGKFACMIQSLEPVDYLIGIKQLLDNGPSQNIENAYTFSKAFAWSKCMQHMESTLEQLAQNRSSRKLEDFRHEEELGRAVFIHGEPRLIDQNLTRAREIRISGFRQSLMKTHNVQELFGGRLGQWRYAVMIGSVLDVGKPSFIYIEGSSSMFSSFKRRYSELTSTLKQASSRQIPVVYYLPDAHEYWDDYVISTRSATKVHVARYLKKRLLRLLADNGAIIAYPSSEFKQALMLKLDNGTVGRLAKNKSLILPPGASAEVISKGTDSSKLCYVYAGGIGPFYKLQRWLIALNQNEISINAVFFIRQGDLSALEPKYKELLLSSNVSIQHGALPRVVSNDLQIGLLLLEPIEYIAVAVPLKFYSYLERGWPVLCYRDTAIGNIVDKYGLGWAIENSVEAISEFHHRQVSESEYKDIQANIKKYIANNQWGNRVQQIVESAQ
jgi:glycosyltransferase involved in cell wall biosynthesis